MPGILFTFAFMTQICTAMCYVLFYLFGFNFEHVLYRFSVIASLFIDTGFHTSAFLFIAQTSQILFVSV